MIDTTKETSMPKRFMLATLCALSLTFISAAAHAQLARYCDDRLVVNSFYNTVQSNGSRATSSYFAQVQNRTKEPVRYSLRFTAPKAVEAQNGSVVSTLAPYQQVTILLGKQQFNNPSGAGALSQSDVNRYTQAVCPK